MRSDDVTVSRQGDLVVVNHNKFFEIKFNLSKGTWDYVDESGDTIIRNGCTQVTFDDGSVIKTEDTGTREFITELPKTDVFGDYHQLRFSHEATGKGIRINTYLNCYSAHPAIHLKVGIENLKPEPLQLDSVTVLGVSANRGAALLGTTPSECHLFINMPPISPGVSKRLYDGFLLSETDAMHPSHDGVLHDTQSGKALVFGFLTTEKWWPRIQVGCQGNGGQRSQSNAKKASVSGVNPWALYHQCRQHCDAGEEILSETVYINFTGGAKAAYEHYTALRAKKSGLTDVQSTMVREDSFAAWSFSNTSEPLEPDAILTQAEALVEHPLFQPNAPGGICYIQLDTASGLQSPETLNQVHAKGFKTGIRVNPFALTLDSELVQNHPDYCIQEQAETRGGKRQPRKRTAHNRSKPATIHLPDTGKEVALLDVSHPEVQARVREQIKHIVSDCGYSLIDVDFTAYTIGLTNASHNLQWHDDSLTAVQLYRFAAELLRDIINEVRLENVPTKQNVMLAGYNAISDLCVGSIAVNAPLLNAPFTGGTSNRASDQWHHQRGTKHRLSRYAAYLREHNVLWNHLFGELAVDEPRPINEAIVEMTAAALSGGTVLCADSIATLTPLRAAYLAKIFPLINKAATPVDIYDEPFPKIWSLPISTPRETWYLAAVFNWNDREDDVYFQLDTLGVPESNGFLVHDFWMRQYLGKVSQSVNLLNIPPRSAKLLCFREEQEVPQLLATDIHYTQGSAEILSAGWDRHSQSYLLVCKPLRQAEGTCFIHVPEDYLPISVATYGSDYEYNWDKPIYQLTFTETQPDQLVHASIHFAKTSGGTV
ncbi:hypothetical protein C6503_22380 [Candidatus Poribacteria bacterium]|nr:MAG: hypothetical protein C6503_22380 [Candidatus Poribacteria bacterium]